MAIGLKYYIKSRHASPCIVTQYYRHNITILSYRISAAGAGANGRLVGGDRHGPPRRTTDHIGRDAVLLLLLLPDDGTDLLVVDRRCGRANTSRR